MIARRPSTSRRRDWCMIQVGSRPLRDVGSPGHGGIGTKRGCPGRPQWSRQVDIRAAILKDALGVDEFVNADVIARAYRASSPSVWDWPPGGSCSRGSASWPARGSSAFETTLANRSFAPWIADLMRTGYQFHLVFLWLPHPDVAVARVAARVRDWGTDVPEETIRRRYEAGLSNFFSLYQPIARTWEFCDNSAEPGTTLIASGAGVGPEGE